MHSVAITAAGAAVPTTTVAAGVGEDATAPAACAHRKTPGTSVDDEDRYSACGDSGDASDEVVVVGSEMQVRPQAVMDGQVNADHTVDE